MQALNPLATELNEQIHGASPALGALLSELGHRIYLPKGILSQTAEAAATADCLNATRAIAVKGGALMHLAAARKFVPAFAPEDIYGYAPVLGQPELREAWKTHLLAANPSLAGKTFSLPVVTSGMTHGLSLLAELFVDSGDVLLLPDKIWGNYRLIFETKAGASLQSYPFFNATKGFSTEGLGEQFAQVPADKAIVLLNFPHNPTGYAINEAEAERIVDALVARADTGCRLLVIVDDAYAGLWFDPSVMHESLFGRLIGCHRNVIPVKVDGATKEEYGWGLRVGFITFGLDTSAMRPLEQKLSGLIRAGTSGAAQFSQTLVLETMKAPEYAEQKRENHETLKARAARAKAVASDTRYAKLWEVYPSHAGYFICLGLKSGKSEAVRQRLLTVHGIGTISLGETELRVAYSCLEESEIESVFAAIAEAIETTEAT